MTLLPSVICYCNNLTWRHDCTYVQNIQSLTLRRGAECTKRKRLKYTCFHWACHTISTFTLHSLEWKHCLWCSGHYVSSSLNTTVTEAHMTSKRKLCAQSSDKKNEKGHNPQKNKQFVFVGIGFRGHFKVKTERN